MNARLHMMFLQCNRASFRHKPQGDRYGELGSRLDILTAAPISATFSAAMKTTISALLLALALPFTTTGQPEVPEARKGNLALVKKAYQDNIKKYAKNKGIMVRPGLVADRSTKQIKIMAEATAIGATDPAEFILISQNSGHDYEAIAVSFAKPSDIHDALIFIGMQPGSPVDYQRLRMWPKGERVVITFEWDYPSAPKQPSKPKHYRVRAESLILDRQTDGPVKAVGFAFVGSTWIAKDDNPDEKLYSADISGPNSIVSLYNDPETVLDWPGQAAKEVVYSFHLPNPRYKFDKGQLVSVLIEPEHKGQKKRIADLHLITRAATEGLAAGIADLQLSLKTPTGKTVLQSRKIADVLGEFEKLAADDRDPHVRVNFGADISLDAIHKVCSILEASDTDSGIHVGPPDEGQPYYRAFLPDEKLRNRKQRILQPWEFRISQKNGALSAELTLVNTVWIKDKQSTVIDNFEIKSPGELRKKISERSKTGRRLGPMGVFVFAPGPMSYGTLAPFLAEIVHEGHTVFVYLD